MATSQYEFVTLTGVIVPDTADTQTIVENEFKNAFGSDLVVTPDTPQGVMITDETLARDSVLRNNAAVANQINPSLAGGVFLDALWALTGGKRTKAASSSMMADLAGVAGTVIPEGVTGKLSTTGNVFASASMVTLDGSGNASVEFIAVETGPIDAAPGTLVIIENGVLGWETITNPEAAVLGTTTQSDISSRLLRRETLALQGTSLPEAITSALYITDGVRSLTFRENITNSTQVIDGVTMVAHSIYACVDGGTNEDVATTLLAKKSAGAAWNGDTSIAVTDPVSGQVYPVQFDRPDLIGILARVYIRISTTISNPEDIVKKAIVDYANGLLPNEPGFVVGGNVSPFELSGAVNIESPGIYVQKVEISYITPVVFVVEELPIEIFEKATIDTSSITVFSI